MNLADDMLAGREPTCARRLRYPAQLHPLSAGAAMTFDGLPLVVGWSRRWRQPALPALRLSAVRASAAHAENR
jgi:hypothetical protein